MITFASYAEHYEAAPADEWRDFEPEAETEDCGPIIGLRNARDFLFEAGGMHSCGVHSIEPSCSDWSRARSITAYASMDYRTGETENRTICFPESLTAATRARICRAILGA